VRQPDTVCDIRPRFYFNIAVLWNEVNWNYDLMRTEQDQFENIVRYQLSLNLLANIHNNCRAINITAISFDGIPISLQLAQNWLGTCDLYTALVSSPFQTMSKVQTPRHGNCTHARDPVTKTRNHTFHVHTHTHTPSLSAEVSRLPRLAKRL